MAVLILKLSGPLQSWGTTLKLKDHETDSMPSKSGVIGMIAAAFGRRRDSDISDLAALRFGVRADRPGTILRDYHTAHIWDKRDTYVGNRQYLQDACFTVGLEGDRPFLEECAAALKHPVFPPYLGRRSCVPDPGIVVGVFDRSLEDVLKTLPAQCEHQAGFMRICVETDDDGDRMRHDSPISFDFKNRQYAYRMEKEIQKGNQDVYQ